VTYGFLLFAFGLDEIYVFFAPIENVSTEKSDPFQTSRKAQLIQPSVLDGVTMFSDLK
jgi:hypothetical protein